MFLFKLLEIHVGETEVKREGVNCFQLICDIGGASYRQGFSCIFLLNEES